MKKNLTQKNTFFKNYKNYNFFQLIEFLEFLYFSNYKLFKQRISDHKQSAI